MDSSEKIKLVKDRCLEVFEDPTMYDGWLKSPFEDRATSKGSQKR